MRKPPPYNKKVNPISFMISPITTFTDEEIALKYLEELLEEGEDRSEMEAFIEEHGHKDFYDHFDEYREAVKEFDQDTVDAFLEDFDISDISHLSDAYYGQYDSEEEFAENFVTECYGLPDMPSWIKIDWEETWEDGLSWDYTYTNGYVFCNHY